MGLGRVAGLTSHRFDREATAWSFLDHFTARHPVKSLVASSLIKINERSDSFTTERNHFVKRLRTRTKFLEWVQSEWRLCWSLWQELDDFSHQCCPNLMHFPISLYIHLWRFCQQRCLLSVCISLHQVDMLSDDAPQQKTQQKVKRLLSAGFHNKITTSVLYPTWNLQGFHFTTLM